MENQRSTDRWYDALFHLNPLPMYIFDPATLDILDTNAAARAQYGLPPDGPLPPDLGALAPGLSRDKDVPPWQQLCGRQRHERVDGRCLDMELTCFPLRCHGRQAILVIARDVTESLAAEARLRHQALTDDLTGLPNRRWLMAQLAGDLTQATPLLVAVIQLDRLQELILTLGQPAGDALLRQVGPRVSTLIGRDVPLYRIGDEQFALSLPVTDAAEADGLLQQLTHGLCQPFQIADMRYAPGLYLGAALFPDDGQTADDLLQHAAVAVYQAKESGTRLAYYEAARDPYSPHRLSMLGGLQQAIDQDELQLFCQPKMDLRTGEVVAAEALVRWQHPQHGLVSPAAFIPLAESTELMAPLTMWMLRKAVTLRRQWQAGGMQIPIAVNLSARQLHDEALVDDILGLLQEAGGEPAWLDLEITESSIMAEPKAARRNLDRLKAHGFRLYIDDYGTGHSNLSYLMQLPVDYIKLDSSFVMQMLEDRRAAAIVRSSIELAHDLERRIIAEGVASAEILERLQALGCDEAQGSLIADPLPADNLPAWLNAARLRLEGLVAAGRQAPPAKAAG